jgi:hypothetical protein
MKKYFLIITCLIFAISFSLSQTSQEKTSMSLVKAPINALSNFRFYPNQATFTFSYLDQRYSYQTSSQNKNADIELFFDYISLLEKSDTIEFRYSIYNETEKPVFLKEADEEKLIRVHFPIFSREKINSKSEKTEQGAALNSHSPGGWRRVGELCHTFCLRRLCARAAGLTPLVAVSELGRSAKL